MSYDMRKAAWIHAALSENGVEIFINMEYNIKENKQIIYL